MKLNKQQMRQLKAASGLRKSVKFVYPDGYVWIGKVVDEVYNISDHYKNIIQQIKSDEPDDGFYYRFVYYAYSLKTNCPVFVPRSLQVSAEQCQELLAEARAKGWDMFK